MIECKIYTLAHPITNEIRYIGQTVLSLGKRLSSHISEVRYSSASNHKVRWINSLLKQDLKPVIELLEDNAIWNESEMYWIEQFRQWGFDLVNYTLGGGGTLGIVTKGFAGKKHTNTSKSRMSTTRKGRKLTKEHVEKIRLKHLGSKRSEQARKNMSMGWKLKKLKS